MATGDLVAALRAVEARIESHQRDGGRLGVVVVVQLIQLVGGGAEGLGALLERPELQRFELGRERVAGRLGRRAGGWLTQRDWCWCR